MKKNILLFIAGILMIATVCSLFSCDKQDNTITTTDSTTATTEKQEKLLKSPLSVDVMDELYGAKGDGVTSDRAVIQLAIDEVSAAGGGTVELTAGHTFLSGNLLLKSNVTLHFGDGAKLLQNPDPSDYIEAVGYDYGAGFVDVGEPYTPIVGKQLLPYDGIVWPAVTEVWRECWYWNYPLLYAGEGTENITVEGNGTIESMDYLYNDPSDFIYMHMMGFYKVKNITVSGITFNYKGSHCCNFVMCNNGAVLDVTMMTPAATAEDMNKVATICDSLKLDNCQDFIISGCTLGSGDDACLIMNTYGDQRKDRWSSSTAIQPCKNIEISSCYFLSYYKGLGFCAIGNACPDLSQAEISDIYIHDNHFCSVGMWSDHRGWLASPDLPSYGEYVPMKNLRWENNDYEYWPNGYNHNEDAQSIQKGMMDYPISDQISDDPRLHSMSRMYNADFEYCGIGYWIPVTESGTVAEVRQEGENHYAYLGNLEKGNVKLYEGVYLRFGDHTVTAKVRTGDGARVRLYVCDQNNEIIASTEISEATDWTDVSLVFQMPGNALLGQNCRIGIESTGDRGWVAADDFTLR